ETFGAVDLDVRHKPVCRVRACAAFRVPVARTSPNTLTRRYCSVAVGARCRSRPDRSQECCRNRIADIFDCCGGWCGRSTGGFAGRRWAQRLAVGELAGLAEERRIESYRHKLSHQICFTTWTPTGAPPTICR